MSQKIFLTPGRIEIFSPVNFFLSRIFKWIDLSNYTLNVRKCPINLFHDFAPGLDLNTQIDPG